MMQVPGRIRQPGIGRFGGEKIAQACWSRQDFKTVQRQDFVQTVVRMAMNLLPKIGTPVRLKTYSRFHLSHTQATRVCITDTLMSGLPAFTLYIPTRD